MPAPGALSRSNLGQLALDAEGTAGTLTKIHSQRFPRTGAFVQPCRCRPQKEAPLASVDPPRQSHPLLSAQRWNAPAAEGAHMFAGLREGKFPRFYLSAAMLTQRSSTRAECSTCKSGALLCAALFASVPVLFSSPKK